MKARYIFFFVLLATCLGTVAQNQNSFWVPNANRAKSTSISFDGADSVVFRSTMFRIYEGSSTRNRTYSNFLDYNASADSSVAFFVGTPERIIWKPTTSDNNYNNDYTNPESQWSYKNSKESEHFVVFWDKRFGSNPNASSVPSELRVDVNDLLKKAEQFFTTNVDRLKMCDVGIGKSRLDQYKMIIHLLYDTGWTAVGSGYDDMIGALWVTPSTCHPVGSTIAHEIGHCFQYMVATDHRMNGKSNYTQYGWRYGFGAGGEGGNAFWEQCAQWQAHQDYPSETFGYHIDVWKSNYHRHVCHEWMRYASYWWQYCITEKYGYEAYGRLWRESKYPEDPLETYTRLFCNGDLSAFWDEYWTNYAALLPNYQFKDVHRYANTTAKDYDVSMNRTADGYWQVAYASCPETSGVNIIQLTVPEDGAEVKADFVGLDPGSALHSEDPGHSFTEDGGATYNLVTKYNTAGAAANKGWRYGFVAVKNDQTLTSELYRDNAAEASYVVPEGTTNLYFVVIGAPTKYGRHNWNEKDSDDQQWPYMVRFSGTNRKGYLDFDPDAAPCDTLLSQTVRGDGNSSSYELGLIYLKNSGLLDAICEAFKIQPASFADRMLPISAGSTGTPQEGKICLAMKNPSGTYAYKYTANSGFWCSSTGAVQDYGSAPVFVEYSTSYNALVYGHMPNQGKGKTYVIRPTFVYTKDGTQYYATIELTLQL